MLSAPLKRKLIELPRMLPPFVTVRPVLSVAEVIEVSGASVRIGIDAPKSIPVYREELWKAVKAENEAAAKSDAKLRSHKRPVQHDAQLDYPQLG